MPHPAPAPANRPLSIRHNTATPALGAGRDAQLEALRMLTNHEMDSGAIFVCLLIGRPTLRHRVQLGVLAASHSPAARTHQG